MQLYELQICVQVDKKNRLFLKRKKQPIWVIVMIFYLENVEEILSPLKTSTNVEFG